MFTSNNDSIKLIDFGISQFSHETSSNRTQGTPEYMAPELLDQERYINSKNLQGCDYWALGCIIYEMLSGRKAYEGSTFSEVKDIILNGWPLSL